MVIYGDLPVDLYKRTMERSSMPWENSPTFHRAIDSSSLFDPHYQRVIFTFTHDFLGLPVSNQVTCSQAVGWPGWHGKTQLEISMVFMWIPSSSITVAETNSIRQKLLLPCFLFWTYHPFTSFDFEHLRITKFWHISTGNVSSTMTMYFSNGFCGRSLDIQQFKIQFILRNYLLDGWESPM